MHGSFVILRPVSGSTFGFLSGSPNGIHNSATHIAGRNRCVRLSRQIRSSRPLRQHGRNRTLYTRRFPLQLK